jgi:hypothetical protein
MGDSTMFTTTRAAAVPARHRADPARLIAAPRSRRRAQDKLDAYLARLVKLVSLSRSEQTGEAGKTATGRGEVVRIVTPGT